MTLVISNWVQQPEDTLNATQRAWVERLREPARQAFDQLGFPTTRDEAWRFTNIAPLTRIAFQPAQPTPHRITRSMIQHACLADAYCLVFINGTFASSLSARESLPRGALLGSLADHADTLQRHAENSLGQYADSARHALTALNTACFQDAAVVILAKGTMVERPIHLLFVSVVGDQPAVTHPRVLVLAEANSRATILESFVCHDGGDADAAPRFTNAVTEIAIGEDANISYCRLQGESTATFHIGTTQVQLGAGARLDSHVISSGGKLARHELNVVLDGEGAECNLNGLAVARGKQLIDHLTRIDHVTPRGTSHESYKAVIDDDAHGVFSGKIHVHPGAQKTDARQTNHTLLLSDNAVMDTQPQLEIYADDVKCTHGASIGSLDEQAVFYLRSRGIDAYDARRLLTFAFMNEVLERVGVDALRSHLQEHLSGLMQVEGNQSTTADAATIEAAR